MTSSLLSSRMEKDKINEKLVVEFDKSIDYAMRLVDSNGFGMCCVCDADKRIIGLITDGDIRRGILNDIDLSSPVEQIVRKDFHYVFNGKHLQLEADLLGYSYRLKQIPVLDSEGRLLDIIFLYRNCNYEIKDNPVVIMAGGLGQRLRPLTNDCPKPLLPIGSRPILERILLYFKYYGFRNFYISINYLGHMISDYFKTGETLGINIEYLHEKEKGGTAGSLVLLPKQTVPFVVTNGDLIYDVDLDEFLKCHTQANNLGTMCVRQHSFQIPFGVVNEVDGTFTGIIEKPNYNFMINAGLYCFDPSVMNFLPENGKIEMTSLFEKMMIAEEKLGVFKWSGRWVDIGTVDEYQKICKETVVKA